MHSKVGNLSFLLLTLLVLQVLFGSVRVEGQWGGWAGRVGGWASHFGDDAARGATAGGGFGRAFTPNMRRGAEDILDIVTQNPTSYQQFCSQVDSDNQQCRFATCVFNFRSMYNRAGLLQYCRGVSGLQF